MKTKFFIIFIYLLTGIAGISQTPDYSLARVKKVSGKLVFYNNEPIEKYEIVFSFQNIIPDFETISTNKIMDAGVLNAMDESGLQGGKYFDAIITVQGAKRDLAIKFIDNSKDISIARVPRINGKYVFIECEPLNNYEIVDNIKVKEKSNKANIDKILKIALKKDNKGKKFDGIMYGSTKYDSSIKFM